jgi:outer membrane protein assembly factor BamB
MQTASAAILLRRLGRATLVGIAILAATLPTQAVDWYRWRGPNLDGISTETGWSATWPKEGPKTLWKAKVGIGFNSFTVSQGRAYIVGNTDNKDTVFCFDAATGKEVWKYTFDAPLDAKYYEGGPSASPTIDGDNVYTLSKRGIVNSLNAATGKLLWTKDLTKELGAKIPEWGFAGSVLVYADRLYVNVGKYGTCLDKSGKVIWTTGTEQSGYSSFVPFTIGGVKGLAVFAAKDVAGIDPETGKVLWSHPWKTNYDVNAADPIIQGDIVFISSGYNAGCAAIRIDQGQTKLLWQNKNMRNHFNSCVLIGGYLYGWDEGSDLRCIDLKTGDTKWSQADLGKKQQGAIMAADGKLIVQGGKGELLVTPADPAGFKPSAQAQVLGGKCWSTPVLSNGRIYCRNAAGDVVCLDVSGK